MEMFVEKNDPKRTNPLKNSLKGKNSLKPESMRGSNPQSISIRGLKKKGWTVDTWMDLRDAWGFRLGLAHLSSFCFPAWNERNMLACRCHSLVVPPRVARSRRIRTPTAGFGSSRRASSSSPICVNAAKAPSSPSPCSVLCIGEVLFDALPDAIFLGAAPLNRALHMARPY